MSEFEFYDTDNLTLEGAVFQALGAASVCWENPGGAGVFDSSRALVIGNALLEWIRNEGAHTTC